MPITITIHGENAPHALLELREFADGLVGRPAPSAVPEVKNDAGPQTTQPPIDNDHVAAGAQKFTDQEIAMNAKRERGKPAPGRARRTKEEIAEDEAADKVDAALSKNEALQAEQTEAVQAAISTGEERVGPEDDAATVAQDEADEKAESSALFEERPADKKLTHDDVRQALGAYVKAYGMAAAQADGPKVISLALKNDKAVKISDIPDDQAALKAVVAGVEEMTLKNPFKHAKVA